MYVTAFILSSVCVFILSVWVVFSTYEFGCRAAYCYCEAFCVRCCTIMYRIEQYLLGGKSTKTFDKNIVNLFKIVKFLIEYLVRARRQCRLNDKFGLRELWDRWSELLPLFYNPCECTTLRRTTSWTSFQVCISAVYAM